jgi:hypothetical protein
MIPSSSRETSPAPTEVLLLATAANTAKYDYHKVALDDVYSLAKNATREARVFRGKSVWGGECRSGLSMISSEKVELREGVKQGCGKGEGWKQVARGQRG